MTTEDIQHWQGLSLEEQFGNIGSEVSRMLRARKEHNPEREESALTRMIYLFSASKSDKRWRNQGALVEFCRAQEVVCDFFYGNNTYGSSEETLIKYFDAFARTIRKTV